MSCPTFRPLIAIILTLIAYPAFAQRDRDSWLSNNPTEIAGEVRFANGEAMARNVVVRLERFGGGVLDQMMTDSRGKFRFAGLQRGQYTVSINAQGFTTAPQQVDLQVVFKAYLIFELTAEKSASTSNLTGSAGVIDARVPVEAQKAFAKGQSALLEKKVKDAIPHLEKAVSIYPEFFEAHLLLGTAYTDAQQWNKAEGTLRRALEIKPKTTSVLFSLGEVHRRQKRYAEAEKVLQEGLQIDDSSWQGHFTLGRVYWEMDHVMKAGPHLGRTLQLKPDFAEAHLLAGNILLRIAQPERALTEYLEYLRLAPKGEFASQAQELVQKLKKSIAEKK